MTKLIENLKALLKDDSDDDLPADLDKSAAYRYSATEYYAISGSDIISLGYEDPEDSEDVTVDPEDPNANAGVAKYGLLLVRGDSYSGSMEYKSAGNDLTDAHSQAMDLILNNKNNIRRVSVLQEMPKTIGKKPLHCSVATYVHISNSEFTDYDIRLTDDSIADIILKTTETQSIIFPKDKYTVAEAKAWLGKHGKKSSKVDTTDNYHRFRQFDPSECSSTPKTIAFGSGGIKAIICTRKSTKSAKPIDEQIESIVNVVKVIKSELNKGLVYGIVYSPNVLDSHGDHTSAEEIENAAHSFLPSALKNGTNGWTDINHSEDVEENSIEVVESYIAPADFKFESGESVSKGSWILVAKVKDPELKDSIAKGEITGFSLEGTAQKV